MKDSIQSDSDLKRHISIINICWQGGRCDGAVQARSLLNLPRAAVHNQIPQIIQNLKCCQGLGNTTAPSQRPSRAAWLCRPLHSLYAPSPLGFAHLPRRAVASTPQPRVGGAVAPPEGGNANCYHAKRLSVQQIKNSMSLQRCKGKVTNPV